MKRDVVFYILDKEGHKVTYEGKPKTFIVNIEVEKIKEFEQYGYEMKEYWNK